MLRRGGKVAPRCETAKTAKLCGWSIANCKSATTHDLSPRSGQVRRAEGDSSEILREDGDSGDLIGSPFAANELRQTMRIGDMLNRRVVLFGVLDGASFVAAAPAFADPILTPIITSVVAAALGEGVASFSIFGVTISAAITGIVTTATGRSLKLLARR